MRVGLLTLLGLQAAAASGVAFADPVEGSGFAGVSYFHESGLGDAPSTSINTAPQVGARITLFPWRTPPTEVGGELELSYIHSSAQMAGKDVDVPIVAYRGLVVVRLSQGRLRPHLAVGAGGATVTTTSVVTRRDTDLALITGIGATIPLSATVHLRADVRQNWMESQSGGWAAMYDFNLCIGGTFGAKRNTSRPAPLEVAPPPPTPVVAATPPPPPLDNKDSDNDGIVDRLDKCPNEREDLDLNDDTDGCPDLDDDADGIADTKDKCPLKPETMNGIADDDGCPDELPEKYVVAFTAASQVTFDKNGTRLSESAKSNLDKAAALLVATPNLRVGLTVHPEANSEAGTALASKRLNAVKWYLREQGVADKQLDAKIGAVGASPVIELALVR
jgi:outer membrane protein OmpA-like peptidoglycan-associated protein